MTPQEIAAYNEKHNLAGKPNELLQVVNSRNGKIEVLSRKNLALVKGFRLYEPSKAPTPIDVKDLSDDVLAIEQERQRLAEQVDFLTKKLVEQSRRQAEPPVENPYLSEADFVNLPTPPAEPTAKKKIGRPRKEGIQKTSDA